MMPAAAAAAAAAGETAPGMRATHVPANCVGAREASASEVADLDATSIAQHRKA